jgi:hypothetical protein
MQNNFDTDTIRTYASEDNRFLIYRVRPLRHGADVIIVRNLILIDNNSSRIDAIDHRSAMVV